MTMIRVEGKRALLLGFIINAVVIFPIKPTLADESVRLLWNYDQLVTSTTLNWLPISHYNPTKHNIVVGGFEMPSRGKK